MDVDPRYPIGLFRMEADALAPGQRETLIEQIAEAPAKLREAVRGLSSEQLDTPYRPGGWTARQVVHHLPDSHMNAYIRFKLALTEEEPALRTYEEGEWAKLADVRDTPVEVSLDLLGALHQRWVLLLRALSAREFARAARHPGWGRVSVDWLLAQYAWHGRHHVAHITSLRDRMGWN
jgi:DinB family protein